MPRTRVIHVDDMRNHPDAVYIGRAVPRRGLKASTWANPYKIGRDGDRAGVVRRYRAHLLHRITFEPGLLEELRNLVGKPLACWCRHDGEERTEHTACHGDVLVELIASFGLEDKGR